MLRRTIAAFALWAALAGGLGAQEDRAWVQVEALPTLGRAQEVVEGYASQLPDVAGYYLGTGWYAVTLGPYAPGDARALLDRLVADGLVPRDAFLADGGQFRQQFWPIGVAAETAPQPLPEAVAQPAAEASPAPEAGPEPAAEPEAPAQAALDPALPDETTEEAVASERLLSQAQKEQLQVALQWAGVYEGAIDGAFGRGTRTAMALWQQAQGLEPTGVLTTRERAALVAAYNAVLEGLDLRLVSDRATGIEVRVPLGVVDAAAVEPPFVRFDPSQDFPAQVLLISQPGDRDRLWGLYEIMQTLEVVPPEGPRERSETGFTIEGVDAEVHSVTEVSLEDGEIKGFTLVWPVGDEERRARVLGEMRASFRRLPGVLDPGAGEATEEQAVDLVSGLAVRQPRATASGFYVDASGTAVTAAAAVEGCEAVTIDEAHPARVAAVEGGLALLAPEAPLAPRAFAAFQTAVPRLGAEVAVAGYPYGGVLAQPALTFGELSDIRGLNGEEEVKRLALAPLAGDAGGAVVDAGGAVLGMLLPAAAEGGTVLPEGVSFALDAEAILAVLAREGIEATTTGPMPALPPERLTREAAGMAVLVSCW